MFSWVLWEHYFKISLSHIKVLDLEDQRLTRLSYWNYVFCFFTLTPYYISILEFLKRIYNSSKHNRSNNMIAVYKSLISHKFGYCVIDSQPFFSYFKTEMAIRERPCITSLHFK